MDLQQCLRALWKWAWLIGVAALLSGAVSYFASIRATPVYQTTTTLRVGQFLDNPDPLGSEITTSQALAQSYALAAKRQPILQATLDALKLDWEWQALANNVNATVVGSQFLQITVQDSHPQRVKAIADEIARQMILQSPTAQQESERARRSGFVERQLDSLQGQIQSAERKIAELQAKLPEQTSATAIKEIQDQITSLQLQITTWQATYANLLSHNAGSSTNYLTVFEPASVPRQPVSPNVPRNVLLATLIGLTLAAGAALLMEYLDDTVKNRDDLARLLGRPVLGSIGRISGPPSVPDHLVTLQDPMSSLSEAFRVLRTNLLFMSVGNNADCVLVTSAVLGEGKTTVACNLAAAMALAGKQVILVDADLRRPNVHGFFGVGNDVGLCSLLLDDALTVDEAATQTTLSGLRILPSGPLPPNPGELLASARMKTRLEQIRASAQIVIVDGPPALLLADASVLGRLCDGLVFVARAGRTRAEGVRQARAALEQVGVRLLGGVLNDAASTSAEYYRQHYYTARTEPGQG